MTAPAPDSPEGGAQVPVTGGAGAGPAAADVRVTLVERVFSLTGLVPLGAFLAVHVAVNARAIRGQEAFTATADALARLPALRLIEAIFVFAPLVVHAALGLWLVVARRRFPLASDPSPLPASLARAMRVTGVIVAAFLAMHLPEMRVFGAGPRLHGGEALTVLSADLSSLSHGVPWRGIAYLVGSGAVTLHFALGAWAALARTRRGADPRVRRVGAWAAAAIGGVLLAFFVDVVVLHATGTRLFGRAAPPPVSGAACPDRASPAP